MEQKDSAKAKVDQGNVGNPTESKVFKSDIGQEDKIELERKEAYIEPKTRSLLRKLLQGGDKEEIIPTYALSLGFVYQTTDPNPTGDEKEKISQKIVWKTWFDSTFYKKTFLIQYQLVPTVDQQF